MPMAVERGDYSLHAVLEIGRLADSVVPIDQGFPTLLEAIGQVFAAAGVVLREHHADGTLCVRAAWSDPAGATESVAGRDDGAALCAAEGSPLLAPAPDEAAGAAMHVPLLTHDRAVAVLSVYRRDGSDRAQRDRDDLRLLAAIAGIVGVALASSAALEREAEARTHLEALNAIGRLIASSLEITSVFDTFATETQCLLRHDRLSAHVLTADGLVDELFAAAGDHALEAFSPGERRPVEASLPARVALEDRAFLADDLPSDPRIVGDAGLVVPRNARSWLSVPLRANGRAFGALNFSARMPAVYTQADIPRAQQIADQLATYLDLVRLHRQERDLAVAEERARLAREIHDTLTQDLSLLVLQLQALERTAGLPPSVQAEVAATTEQAHLLLQEARRSVWDLAPSPLEGRDLVTALEEELDRFCEATHLVGRMSITGTPRPIAPAIEAGLLRIAQEALANARKHAQAHRTALCLHYDAEDVMLTVEDDGQGFDPSVRATASASGGFGLTSMRERAHVFGGILDVKSTPGRGTRVTARLPYTARRGGHLHVAAGPARPPGPSPDAASAPEGAMGRIRVLIADDHVVARQGIRRMLEAHGDIVVVGEAADGQEAIEHVAHQKPHVVLLDLQMPRVDGTEALRRLRAQYPTLGVIILTTYAQDERVFAALRDGARGYVLKDVSPDELAKAVRVVAAGGSQLQGAVATRLVGRLQRNDALTARELEVLRLADEGLRSKEIAARLVVSERTVNFHLNNAYRKLDASGRTEALRIARAHGLLFS
jgi:DNA-binding NarL/FixJ family response regulator/signal transduction histidine kinase